MTENEIVLNDISFDSAYDLATKLFNTLDIHKETVYDYTNRIKLFLSFVQKNRFERHILLSYKKYLVDRNDYAVTTKNKYLIVARILIQTMVKEGILPNNFPATIKSFKQATKHKKYGLSELDVKTLSDWTATLDVSPKSLRTRAILSLLVLQGLRQIEITRLDVTDYDIENLVIDVHGKSADEKEPVLLLPQVVAILNEYLRSTNIKSGPLFYSFSNNSKKKRLTTKSIRVLIKECFSHLGIKRTTHGCRHYFVTRLIKRYQGNLVQVSQLTRHKSLNMLQVYYDTIEQEQNKPKFLAAFEGISI